MGTLYTLFLLVTMLCLALATPINPPGSLNVEPPLATAKACGFEGNPDVYSLGIRLGLHLQWASAYFTRHLLPEAVLDLAGITFIFELALIVAALNLTKSSDTTYSIELVILTIMLLSDVWLIHVPIMFSYHSYHQRPSFSITSLLTRDLMMYSLAAFAIWVPISGYNQHHLDPCGTSVFPFKKVPNFSRKCEVKGLVVGVACTKLVYLILLNASKWSRSNWSSLARRKNKSNAKTLARQSLLPLNLFYLEDEINTDNYRNVH